MASSLLRLLAIRIAPFIVGACGLLAAVPPAEAQTVVGNGTNPSVTVDLSVLDSLGPPRTLPDLLRGKPPQRRATTLATPVRPSNGTVHPPKKGVATKPAKGKTKAPPPDVAAKRAAPIAPVAAAANGAGDKTGAAPRDKVTTTTLPEPPAPAAEAAADKPATATPAPVPAPPAAAPPQAVAPMPAAAPPAAAPPPVAAPPTPVPTVPPSPTAIAAMNTPPSVPATAPVSPTPVTPAAAPATLAPGGTARILFATGNAELPDDAKPRLDALITQLTANERQRLQLVAYADGSPTEANQARRISLQRALEVRKYLMERGVPATRMDVRALGNRSEGKDPPDRVDIVTLDR